MKDGSITYVYCLIAPPLFILLGHELSPSSHQSQGIINDPHIINLGRYCRSYSRGNDISLAIITIVGLADKRVSSLSRRTSIDVNGSLSNADNATAGS